MQLMKSEILEIKLYYLNYIQFTFLILYLKKYYLEIERRHFNFASFLEKYQSKIESRFYF